MHDITIQDTAIWAVNRGKRKNEASSILYIDQQGARHQIDFETCAENYAIEHPESSGNCIGDRNIDTYSFVFYTSGIKTKVVFSKRYVGAIPYRPLQGTRTSRFLTLQRLIAETRFVTCDLS